MRVASYIEMPGPDLTVTDLTADERLLFESQYLRVMQAWSWEMPIPKEKAALLPPEAKIDWAKQTPKLLQPLEPVFVRHKNELLTGAMAAKYGIDGAGALTGTSGRHGFGMSAIRPDYLLEEMAGRSFTATLSGLKKDEWYGLWHHGPIGGSYNAYPLYMRKEVCVIIIGFMDVGGMVDELQFEVDGITYATINITRNISGSRGGFPFYELPTPFCILPRRQYRCRMKVNAAAGEFNLIPIGLAFARADFMRNTAPIQPAVYAP